MPEPIKFKRTTTGGYQGIAAAGRTFSGEFILLCPDSKTLEHIWGSIMRPKMNRANLYHAHIEPVIDAAKTKGENDEEKKR